MAVFYLDKPLDFMSRTNNVSAFQDFYVKEVLGPNASLPSALPALLIEQTRRTLSMFVTTGDWSGFYSSNLSSFDPLSAALMWLGFGVLITRIRRYHELSLLVWIVITLLLGSVFILGARNGQRILIMTPAAFLLGGVLVARAHDMLRRVPLRSAAWLVVPAGTTLALWTLSANVTTYFYDFVPRDENAEMALTARESERDAGQYHVYFLTWPRFDTKHGAVTYIAYASKPTDLNTAADFKPPNDGLGVMVIAMEQHLPQLRIIEARMPGGQEQQVFAPTGRLLYTYYRVPPPG
jgi:hypothetical protein